MATRFTRVTVSADERSIDLSLPADRPIMELLPQLRDLMSLPPRTDGAWVLSSVSAGALDQGRTLSEAGVLDADLLYLTPPQEAPAPPAVDDVIDEVQSILDSDGSEWTGDARTYGCCALAAVVVLALTGAVPFLALRPVGVVALLADLAGSAVIAGWLLRGRGGDFLAVAALPAWALAGVEAARLAEGGAPALVAAGLAGAGLGCAALALVGPRWYGLAAGGAVALVAGLLGVALVAVGLDGPAVAAVAAVLVSFAAGLAPQAALARSRLVPMLRAEEKGEQAGRQEVAAAVRRGQTTLTGAVGGIAVVAAVACAVLVARGSWFGTALGVVLGVAFALRSRAFTRAGQVWPMLLPAVVAAAVAVITVPGRLGASTAAATWVAFAGPLVLIVVTVVAGRPVLGEVGAARWRHIFDLVETVALVALVPLAVAVVGGFDRVTG
ncbi:type VII secretion integral membrane protein EccD [Planosporangium sp. 12N6]|uniref:type VII secretion integral membrane protein EccD n=1 Tax=Planosporangium spinosum TaxID=3402278 RepID=UPI003CEFB998